MVEHTSGMDGFQRLMLALDYPPRIPHAVHGEPLDRAGALRDEHHVAPGTGRFWPGLARWERVLNAATTNASPT